MDDWLSESAAGADLSENDARLLDERGFVVLAGPVPPSRIAELGYAYDAAVSSAAAEDIKIGRTTTRVNDFVNRGPEFDAVYTFPPLLAAAFRVIGGPFKLSSLHARTLRADVAAQELHVDVARYSTDWPLLGFILMVDAFRSDNGATRFVPGSHRSAATPDEALLDRQAPHPDEVLACGPAGSLLIFNGSTWHGYSANRTAGPRRSIQGAFIPRAGRAATEFAARMGPETRARLGPAARHVLAL